MSHHSDSPLPNTGSRPDRVMLLGDDGLPKGVYDLGAIDRDAVRLMYELAANSGSSRRLDEVMARFIDEIGTDAFGYVAVAALRLMTENVLEPTLQAVDATAPKVGRRLRNKLRSMASDNGANGGEGA
ncbi:hypothetical protein [Nocardia wallacei]|uniref:hypothetical protein n=1 Tax=Nocardia wallacei TaxID=480035 RepID=UPI0024540C29|nr:hypothetical protein [Nocardia wallacei]